MGKRIVGRMDCSRDGLVVSRFKRRESKVGEKGIVHAMG
jgi:hypothetical protein